MYIKSLCGPKQALPCVFWKPCLTQLRVPCTQKLLASTTLFVYHYCHDRKKNHVALGTWTHCNIVVANILSLGTSSIRLCHSVSPMCQQSSNTWQMIYSEISWIFVWSSIWMIYWFIRRPKKSMILMYC